MKENLVGRNKSAQRQLNGRRLNVSAFKQTLNGAISLEMRVV